MTKKTKRKWVLIGSGSYGLFYGQIDDDKPTTNAIVTSKATVVYGCRNVRYWYGPTGGVTSLAALGPNPADVRNRIGAPCDALITQIVNVYDVAAAAQARFAAVTWTAT